MEVEKEIKKFEAKIKSPVGFIQVYVELEMGSETEFSGTAKLMGFTVPCENGKADGNHYQCGVKVRLPFGELPVEIDVNLATDGTVTGFAYAPKHKPMKIEGVQVQ